MPHTTSRAPDPRPARTKAAIFAAARDLTGQDGEVTVNALAKRAGISRAAFYSHFGLFADEGVETGPSGLGVAVSG